MLDIVLTGDVENDSYDDMEANAEEQNDDKGNDVRGYRFPMPLDLLLSLASGVFTLIVFYFVISVPFSHLGRLFFCAIRQDALWPPPVRHFTMENGC